MLIPGSPGEPCEPCSNGIDSFTLLTDALIIPNVGAQVVASVAESSWAAVGQFVFVSDGLKAGTFKVVTATPGVMDLQFFGYPGDSSPGDIIGVGGKVTPSAVQPTITNPLPVAEGGTGGQTATAARADLGVGGASLSVYATGTAYQLTATPALLDFGTTDPSLVISSPGVWLLLARARIDNNAKTTAAVRTITILLRRTNNTAANIANSSTACKTAIMTTLTFTLAEMELPAIIYTTVNSDDILQLWGSADDISGAGTFDAVEASIVAVKLYDQTI